MDTNHHPRQDGFTVVEMVVAAAALLTLSLVVTQLSLSGQEAQRYSNRLNRLTEVTQRALHEIQSNVRVAVRVFGNDSLGMAYRSRLQPWLGFDPIRSTRLPTVQPSGELQKDVTGSEQTGNELLYARHAWSDVYTCSSGTQYRVDVYRVERLFLKVEGAGLGTPNGALNICRFTSEPLASGTQLDRITDANDRKEVLEHLRDATADAAGEVHEPLQVIWKFAEDPATVGTFRQIQGDGTLSDTPLTPRSSTWQIEQAAHLSVPGVFFPNQASVAMNTTPSVHGVSRFAKRDDNAGLGSGFPHGFEVQVVGPPAARKVLIHLTTVTTHSGLKASFDIQAIIYVREG